MSRAEFKTKENSTNGTIKITKDNLKESLGSIIKKEGEETFKTQVYDIANNAKARKALLNLDSVKSIGQGCTKKLKELYKKEYIDKQ